MERKRKMIFALVMGMFLTVGCSSTKPVTVSTPIQDLKAPEWVVKGSGAFPTDKGKVFYGVGSASGIQNSSLLRSAAENRARNEVAQVFQTYTASLMKDYAASTTAGKSGDSSEEQLVEQAIKTVSGMTLSGVEIIDHWQHPASGMLYSLARLDLAAFKGNLDKAKELDAKTKEYIRQNSDRLHEQLEKKEEMKVNPRN